MSEKGSRFILTIFDWDTNAQEYLKTLHETTGAVYTNGQVE